MLAIISGLESAAPIFQSRSGYSKKPSEIVHLQRNSNFAAICPKSEVGSFFVARGETALQRHIILLFLLLHFPMRALPFEIARLWAKLS
jgi:hypothetical protein